MKELEMYLDFFSFLNFNGRKFFVLRRQVNVSYLASSAAEGHSWEWLLIMKTCFCILPLACHFQEFFHFLQKLWPCFSEAKWFLMNFIKGRFLSESLQRLKLEFQITTLSKKSNFFYPFSMCSKFHYTHAENICLRVKIQSLKKYVLLFWQKCLVNKLLNVKVMNKNLK